MVFRQLAFPFIRIAVAFVVLAEIQTDGFASGRYAQGDHLVGQPVEGIADDKGISADQDDGQQVDQEHADVARKQSVDEDSRQNRSEDTAHTVRRKALQPGND
mgnify:CR=1 FL=1